MAASNPSWSVKIEHFSSDPAMPITLQPWWLIKDGFYDAILVVMVLTVIMIVTKMIALGVCDEGENYQFVHLNLYYWLSWWWRWQQWQRWQPWQWWYCDDDNEITTITMMTMMMMMTTTLTMATMSTLILAIWPTRLPTAPAAPLTTTVSPSW